MTQHVMTRAEKARIRSRAWYAANKERRSAAGKAYYIANKAKICAATKARREANPEKERAAKKAWAAANPMVPRRYSWQWQGINPEQAEAVLQAHSGHCDCCGASKPGGQGGWHVDHDHVTKKSRGVLCHRCNTGLGLVVDRVGLSRISAYLSKE